MFTVSVLSLIVLSSLSAKNSPSDSIIQITSFNAASVYIIAKYDPNHDPGKEITDDPHGPDPHGRDPRGEIHDKKLPANNPDDYLKDDTYKKKDND